MSVDLTVFYDWVKHTRRALFDFLQTVPDEDFREPRIGGKSLLELQVHTCNCYQFWVGEVLSGHPPTLLNPASLAEVESTFADIDRLVTQSIMAGKSGWISWTDEQGHTDRVPAEWLLLHPMTHEFHHKGQIVLIARMLGYTFPEGQFSDLRFTRVQPTPH